MIAFFGPIIVEEDHRNREVEVAMSEHIQDMHIDWEHLDDISGGDREFAYELLSEFVSSAYQAFPYVLKGRNESDVSTLKAEIHTLKGSGRTVGAVAFGNLCESLEQVLISGRLDCYDLLCEKIRNELDQLSASVKSQAKSEAA